MSITVYETYMPLPTAGAAAGTISVKPCTLGNFICDVAGTLTLKNGDASVTYLNAIPVAAGQVIVFDWSMPTGAQWDFAASGARGVFGVQYDL